MTWYFRTNSSTKSVPVSPFSQTLACSITAVFDERPFSLERFLMCAEAVWVPAVQNYSWSEECGFTTVPSCFTWVLAFCSATRRLEQVIYVLHNTSSTDTTWGNINATICLAWQVTQAKWGRYFTSEWRYLAQTKSSGHYLSSVYFSVAHNVIQKDQVGSPFLLQRPECTRSIHICRFTVKTWGNVEDLVLVRNFLREKKIDKFLSRQTMWLGCATRRPASSPKHSWLARLIRISILVHTKSPVPLPIPSLRASLSILGSPDRRIVKFIFYQKCHESLSWTHLLSCGEIAPILKHLV